jgi:signal transduction histidine kinase/BarA-like signal transduction histidine kinase
MASKPNVAGALLAGIALLACSWAAAALAVAAPGAVQSLHVQRDGRELALDPSGPMLRLSASDRDVRVRVRPAFVDRSGVAARQRLWLQGHDPGWIDLPASGERRYLRLAPGRLRLRLAVARADGRWSERGGLTLLVEPPWWRSQPALALAGVLVLAGVGWVAGVRRARRRRRDAWRLAQARQQLAEQHSEAKSRFLATLGHEIRTPMTGVLGMAELLQGSALDPQQRHQVEAIQRAGRHLLRLVNDALDLARIEAGKLVLDDLPFELGPLLQDVAGLLQPLAQAKALGFSLRCDPALPLALRGDATRVRQILFNLGHNAIKFCEQGRVALEVSPGAAGGIVLKVSDSGPGLSDDQQARLFRRFERGAPRDGDHGGGSGLGLAICRELAAAMGGAIRVRSQAGRGAEFVVELPLAAVPLPAAGAVRSGADLPSPAMQLLLVEDDAVVAEVVCGLLARLGHRVVHAPHGLAALAELEVARFDLALLDLDLPGIDGLALARLIRSRGLSLPLLALTARADAEAEPAARAAGMDGFLRKPVTGEILAEAIAAAAA